MNNPMPGTLATPIGTDSATAERADPSSEDLDDLEMAHVAVAANDIEIARAHLALALSEDPDIRAFATTMIRDHSAINEQVLTLADRLEVTARDNEVSRELRADARHTIDELSRLRGEAFDGRYAAKEAAFHQAVNGLVENIFIPNIENVAMKAALQGALRMFLAHQEHVEELASGYVASAGNVDVIRGAYDALAGGDVPAVLETMSPDVEWNEAENFPYADGNPYVGREAILEGLLTRLGNDWDYFNLVVEHVMDAGDNVVALGRYRARHSGTGADLDAQFAHVWWLQDGKITRFQQYTDTHQARAVVGR